MSTYFVVARVPNPEFMDELALGISPSEHRTVTTGHDTFDEAMAKFSELEYEVERVTVETMNQAVIVQGGLS